MDLCLSIDFCGGRVMCVSPRYYEVLGRVMWVTKGLWSLNGQVGKTGRFSGFLVELLSEHQNWSPPDMVKPCTITSEIISTSQRRSR